MIEVELTPKQYRTVKTSLNITYCIGMLTGFLFGVMVGVLMQKLWGHL